MRKIGTKTSLYVVLMIIFLTLSFTTKDVIISQLFAILGIFTGCFGIQQKHNKA
jgi:hypothetical protein